jgi:hypothetical protein
MDQYDSDEDYAQFDDETIFQFEEDRKLDIIKKFKDYIQFEPEFYSILSICSYEILQFIEQVSQSNNKEIIITEHQEELFDDLYMALYFKHGNVYIYNEIAKKIFNRIYV